MDPLLRLFDRLRRTIAGKSRKNDRPARAMPLPRTACASVVIPALNEEKRIAEVVAYALDDPATTEVIVVDDGSVDGTAMMARQAGAIVITSSMLGKGASMHDGIAPARSDILVYLDGDLTDLRPGIVSALCEPLLRDDADFVKARFGRSGGRVTELTAKPMLKIFFPELAGISQPLGGIISARKTLLQALTFEDGYGVDIGLMLDAHLHGARLVEVDVGYLAHDSQPLEDLVHMANEVGRVILGRARSMGRLNVEQVMAMYETQRQAAADIGHVLIRRKGRTSLLLLDMDGTITQSRFVVELARATGHESALMKLLDNPSSDAATRSHDIARLFKYVHRKHFEKVARSLEIRPGVVETVNQFRRNGFMVGIVSDSYFGAAEILRRRIFADFALAHTLIYENDVCTGGLRINPAFVEDSPGMSVCKSNVLRRFLSDTSLPKVEVAWVVGDNDNDLELMRLATRAFAIDPKSSRVENEPGVARISSFHELGAILEGSLKGEEARADPPVSASPS